MRRVLSCLFVLLLLCIPASALARDLPMRDGNLSLLALGRHIDDPPRELTDPLRLRKQDSRLRIIRRQPEKQCKPLVEPQGDQVLKLLVSDPPDEIQKSVEFDCLCARHFHHTALPIIMGGPCGTGCASTGGICCCGGCCAPGGCSAICCCNT